MNGKPCRDCGYELQPIDRGCPRCALNLEAESMIERFIWRRFVPCILVVTVLAAGLVYYLVR